MADEREKELLIEELKRRLEALLETDSISEEEKTLIIDHRESFYPR